MTSLRARALNVLIRYTVKRRLAACKTPEDVRRVFDGSLAIAPKGARFTSGRVGGVSGEWAEATNGKAAAGALLYLHGGGYVSMSPKTHRAITGGFALRGFRVFAPDYRLAPEHKFPAALDDATAVWRALRAEIRGPIHVAGDSAGGGLSLALLLKLRDLREPLPAAACLFSPWTDLAGTGPSVIANGDRDPLLVVGNDVLSLAYAGEADLRNPLVSPLYGEYSGLPPMIFFVGGTEILLDDSRRVAARAKSAGVAADLRVYPEMPHVWPAMSALVPEGGQALDEAAAFLRSARPTPDPSP
jgi:monoterpene epsilon-lactone hydrolase